MSSGEGLVRNAARVLERVNEESGGGSGSVTPADSSRVRPLEDPYLVGEVAAARARRERLARENTEDILHREDRRWDWFLGELLWWPEPLFPACFGGPLPRVQVPRRGGTCVSVSWGSEIREIGSIKGGG